MKIVSSLIAGLAVATGIAATAQADGIVTQRHPAGWTRSASDATPLYSEEQHPVTMRAPAGWTSSKGSDNVPRYADETSSIEAAGANEHANAAGRSHLQDP